MIDQMSSESLGCIFRAFGLRKVVDRSNFDDAVRQQINAGISRTILDPFYDSQFIALGNPNIWKEILRKRTLNASFAA